MIDIGTLRGFLEFDDNATAKLKAFSSTLDQTSSKFDGVAAKLSTAGGALTKFITAPLAAVAAGAVVAGNDFTRTMNLISAVTDSSAADFKRLQSAALEWGQKTQYSANEAASAMLELGKAGFTTDQTIAALPSTLQLAAAANMSLGDAANLTSNVMKTFRLQTTDLAKANDILAAAANSSTIEVTDLREAFKYVGPVAAQSGVSLAQASAAMALLGEAGIKGSMAGTTLRNVLTTLMSPTKKQADLMQELGLQGVYANGKLESLDAIVRRIQQSGADGAKVLELFGDRAGPGMAALVQKGAAALTTLTDQLNKTDGSAKKMADASMKGLPGALENLKGSIETAGTALYGVLEPAFVDAAGAMQRVVDFVTSRVIPTFAALPQSVQIPLVGMAAAVAGIGPALLGAAGALKLFQGMAAGVSAFTDIFVMIGNTVPVLTARLWLMEAAEAGVFATLGELGASLLAFATGPIGLAIAGITALGAALYYFDLIPTIVGWLKELWSIAQDVGAILGGVASVVAGKLVDGFTWFGGLVKDAAVAVYDFAQKVTGINFGAVTTSIVDVGKAVGGWIIDKLSAAAAAVVGFAREARARLGDLADYFRGMKLPEPKAPEGFKSVADQAKDLSLKTITAADAMQRLKVDEDAAAARAAASVDKFAALGTSLASAKTEIANLSTAARSQLATAIQSGAFSVDQLKEKTGLSETALKLFKDQIDSTATSTKAWQQANADLMAVVGGMNWDGTIAGALQLGASVQTVATWFGVAKGEIKATADNLTLFEQLSKQAAEQSQADWKKWVEQQEKLSDEREAAFVKNDEIATQSTKAMYDAMAKASLTSFDYQRKQVLDWQDAAEGAIDYTQDNWIDAYNAVKAEATQKLDEIDQASALAASKSIGEWQGPLQEFTADWTDAVDGVARAFSQLAQIAGNAWGGIVRDIGRAISAMDTIGKSAQAYRQAMANGSTYGKVGAIAGAAGGFIEGTAPNEDAGTKKGQIVGAASGALSGAATGAMVGTMIFPGIGTAAGAAIGAIAGAIVGFVRNLGPSKDEKDGRKVEGDFEKQFGGFGGMQKAVVDAYTQTGRTADQANKDILAMFDAEKAGADETAKAVAKINAVLEQQKNFGKYGEAAVNGITAAIDTANNAYDTVNADLVKVDELQKQIAKEPVGSEKYKELQKQLADVTKEMNNAARVADGTKIASQDRASALAGALVGAINLEIKGGKSFGQAVRDNVAAIDTMRKALEGAGFDGGDAFKMLTKQADMLKDPVSGPILDAITNLSAGFSGLKASGTETEQQFQGLGGQIRQAFDALVAQGESAPDILLAMKDPLQELWEEEQQYGFKLDDATQALLDQAVAAGVVGEKQKSTTDQMLDAMNKLVDIFSKVFPAAADSGISTARGKLGGLDRDINDLIKKDWKLEIDVDYNDPGRPGGASSGGAGGDDAIPMADGGRGRVTRPTLFLVGEAGPEDYAFSGANRSFSRFAPAVSTAPAGPSGSAAALPPVNVTARLVLAGRHVTDVVIKDILADNRGAKTKLRRAQLYKPPTTKAA